MKLLLSFLAVLTITFSHAKRIELNTISLEVPDIVASGNKTTISLDGFSTYSFTRLRADSTAYVFNYTFKYNNALYEFRETSKADIWEWLENEYKPGSARKKEFKHYKIENFESLENKVLDMKMQKFRIEYNQGLRKLTLIYKIDETTQFMASIKSAFPVKEFLAAQDTLVSMLETVEWNVPKLRPHGMFEQKGEIADHIKHHIVRLPFALSNDFDNPVVAITKDDEVLIAYAHADGSEIIHLDKEMKMKNHYHYDRLIHDIVTTKNGFFALSSDDYNMMRYDIYPSLYLTKHKANGDLVYTQSFFKKDNTKFPGSQTYDYYSRDGACLEIADSIGIVYATSEKRFGISNLVQEGAYKTFSVTTGFLKKGKKDLFHVSHCFAMKSVRHKDDAYLFSIGDNDPRGLSLSKVNLTIHKDSTDTTSFWHEVLVPFKGILGDNYTADSHISDPIVWNGSLYIALETEENARTNHDPNPRSANRGMNDIFLVKCSLEGEDVEVTQMTKTKYIEEANGKIAVVGDRLLLVYNEIKYSNVGLVNSIEEKYMYVNEKSMRETMAEDLNSYYVNEREKSCKMPDSGINRDGNDFVKTSDGRIIWVRLMRNTRQLEVIEIDG
ncbi:hypothetical protein K6119_18900 [Paracrocinitomix mangrovi]|uniref:hypothetical protein n=1 Tax=Paracrocinitomix mangrovi TaxID=2862509 RepID=UPI001C8F1357|nr:hypothetical protein [Paracrocinitomix mangrovi]UKN01796.1 hypothetical protein K6119_18900 [Paracrocinitomix mangrovi]